MSRDLERRLARMARVACCSRAASGPKALAPFDRWPSLRIVKKPFDSA